jgi:hypothetical protein
MTSPTQLCQGCGRPAQPGESFDAFRPANQELTEARTPTAADVLCPSCAAERRQREELELAYRFCQQCAAPVEPSRVEWRTTTAASPLGMPRTGGPDFLLFCPRCARAHDGTGRWLVIFLGLVVVGLFVLALLIRLFG